MFQPVARHRNTVRQKYYCLLHFFFHFTRTWYTSRDHNHTKSIFQTNYLNKRQTFRAESVLAFADYGICCYAGKTELKQDAADAAG